MSAPGGFTWEDRGGEVVVHHHGRRAAVLRGWKRRELLDAVEAGDDVQLLLARLPRNRGR